MTYSFGGVFTPSIMKGYDLAALSSGVTRRHFPFVSVFISFNLAMVGSLISDIVTDASASKTNKTGNQ